MTRASQPLCSALPRITVRARRCASTHRCATDSPLARAARPRAALRHRRFAPRPTFTPRFPIAQPPDPLRSESQPPFQSP
jgi:hypothetical protein